MWHSFENNYFGAVLCNVRRNLMKEICKAANGNACAKRAKVYCFSLLNLQICKQEQE